MRVDCSFQLSQTIPGVTPHQVYTHLSDPGSLIGLQPLLVAVEPQAVGAAAAGAASQASAAGTAAPPAEVCYEAVEAFCFGWLTWYNRIAVRQQLLGAESSGAAAGGALGSSSGEPPGRQGGDAEQQAWRMRYKVTSPPFGCVRLEVLWTFLPAAAAEMRLVEEQLEPGTHAVGAAVASSLSAAADAAAEGHAAGTTVRLDVSIQAPWLLRRACCCVALLILPHQGAVARCLEAALRPPAL